MRETILAAAPLAVMLCLAGCGKEAPKPEPVEAPILMKAGEWTITRKTTGYNTPTVTPAQYQAALQKTDEDSLCIAVDAAGIPDANALAGTRGRIAPTRTRCCARGG